MAEPTPVQSSATLAPSAERLELARRFVAITEPGDDLMEGFRAGFENAALDEIEDEAERKAAGERLERIVARFEPHVRKHQPKIIEAYAQAYAREFSADELRQMIAFAESPAGRHYLTQATSLESDEPVMDAQIELMEDLTPLIQEIQKEMCATRTQQRIAAGDTKAKCALSSEPEVLQG